jgi:hypothetical protein
VPEAAQQAVVVNEPWALTKERRIEPSLRAVEPGEACVEEEAPAEAGLIDIANILGAPTVTVVRLSL